ncbi:MAG: type II/IV secretion system protein [Rhodobacteraceae bacterium]|nr:type II/IV secretion system protein [Paracoccaceae bacterium]TVR48213.1 MAG: type II/IV secretion system protein [Paracoccaceae bacterium]
MSGNKADTSDSGATGPVQRHPLPFAFARDHQVVLDGGQLVTGPEASAQGLRLARALARSELDPQVLEARAFQDRLTRVYDRDQGQIAQDVLQFEYDGEIRDAAPRDLLEDAEEAPVVKLVNQILRRAMRVGASDLHIEPHGEGLRARIRVDGSLQQAFDRADVPARRVVSRLKVMSGLDIAETRLPQDGRIALSLGGKAVDVRISTLPGPYGERIVLRLLDRSAGLMAPEELGMAPAQQDMLNRLARQPDGIILATGPTGSGKTTTLYSLLQLADRRQRNILTVEDPIEYELPGISQCQVNSEIGMTFARGLRSVLRQDPDVILVGEIRDGETAQVAAEAALTGHLVFSSVHANNPLSTIVRLRELGVDNYLISATLRGVIAQRLLRRLCPECARPHPPDAAMAERFRTAGLDVPDQIWSATESDEVPCPQCEGAGYRGRVGVFDILEISDDIRAAIDQGASEHQLRVALRGAGLSASSLDGLYRLGLEKVAAGATSADELFRVIGPDP